MDRDAAAVPRSAEGVGGGARPRARVRRRRGHPHGDQRQVPAARRALRVGSGRAPPRRMVDRPRWRLRPVAERAMNGRDFCSVRTMTEALARPLSAEDQTVQSMPDVSPTKWHRAHTTWFFETFVLAEHVAGYESFDPAYGFLFNSYYEAVGPRHARVERGLLTRPGVAEVADYRRHVDAAMGGLLADGADGTGRLPERVVALVELGLNHEQQHQELLLMDIKHVLGANHLHPAYLPGDPA